jgi:predicted phage baseplate assembly protein
MKTSADCRDTAQRRRDLRAHTTDGVPDLNGLDYLEVDPTQTILTVYFLDKAPRNLMVNNVRIDGGVRIRNIKVIPNGINFCRMSDPRVDDCMQVTVDRRGDYSTYTLRLVNTDANGRPTDEPLDGLDPFYAQLDFTFKAGCPSDLDCATQDICPPAPPDETEIDYLAKDYASFRQLILDRLSLLMPDWQERHVPDLGIMLAELMAYTGDYLSYYQDAVATEAYLNTARQRISVRRHTRLVDYRLHEGCNARTWLFIETDTSYFKTNVADLFFITGLEDEQSLARHMLTLEDLRNVPSETYEVFLPLVQPNVETIEVYQAHNSISFYTWGNRQCCLPRGATSATLKDGWATQAKAPQQPPQPPPQQPDDKQNLKPGETPDEPPDMSTSPGHEGSMLPGKAGPENVNARRYEAGYSPSDEEPSSSNPDAPPAGTRLLNLKAGDVLVFEEVMGPITGEKADADPTHRHAVRLTKAEPGVDQLYDQPILEIEWANEDALPFTLCVSAIGRAPGCHYLEDVSIARGNIILVDHGQQVSPPLAWSVSAAEELNPGCDAAEEPFETNPPTGKTPRSFTKMIYRVPVPAASLDAQPQNQIVLPSIPLTYRAPFPSPAMLAEQQALLLSGLSAAVRNRINEIWVAVSGGALLSEDELTELRIIFGAEALQEAGLEAKGHHISLPPGDNLRVAALERLLDQTDELLAKKERRVRVLIARARAGYVLGELEEEEITQMFGPTLAVNLSSDNTQLLGPASLALQQDPRDALPGMSLLELAPIEMLDQKASSQTSPSVTISEWIAQSDLLDSNSSDRHFVVEIDNEGRAHLRFGNDDSGRAPVPNTILIAAYRLGNGINGNVGAGGISHIVFRGPKPGAIHLSVRNPLPSVGGTEQEAMSAAKLLAPVAFRQDMQRAVTNDDYVALAERSARSKIQRAAAPSLRWNGSWYEAQVAVDPLNTEEADDALLKDITDYLYPYRRIGHDLEVLPARYVSLDIGLSVCVKPEYLRGHVEAAILDLFSNRALANGSFGLFHPDNLTFGQSIYLSKLVAAAQAVEGVESADIFKLQRLYEQSNREVEKGLLALGPLEVARLDNDPNFPERGKLNLKMRGGK